MDRLLAIFVISCLFYGAYCGDPTYLGCYEDSSNRLLDGLSFVSDLLVPEKCVQYCLHYSYRLAGVEYGKECYCGNSRKGKSRMADTDCGMLCTGDPTRICGGFWRISIYSTGLWGSAATNNMFYEGCYVDRKERLLDGSSEVSTKLTPDSCTDFCYKKGYTYAGMEYGRECFCGNSLKRSEKRPNGECHSQCDGDPTKNCGGPWRLSVYNTGYTSNTGKDTIHLNEKDSCVVRN